MEELKEQFKEHEAQDTQRFGEIKELITDVKANHLAHMQVAQEKTANDVGWLKWIGMAIIVSLISILGKLFLKI